MKAYMKNVFGIAVLSLFSLPLLAHAQAGNEGLFGILNRANDLISRLLPFVITLTLLVFLWGIFKFVISGGDTDARKEARGYIIWGIIALAVMVSVWGLVNILVRTIGVDNTPPLPPGTVQQR